MQIQSGWQTEPDKLEWVDRGIECQIIRHKFSGHLCGYLEIDPRFAQRFRDAAEVHGGITYSKKGCVGFACAGDYDFKPFIDTPSRLNPSVYRTVAYVEEELGNLISQYLALKESHHVNAA